jgi:cell division protein FtsQ
VSTVGELSQRYQDDLEAADLRYPNGYALRLRGVTTGKK